MSKHETILLDKLITSYEKSLHANPFQKSSNRRIIYPMKKYTAYDVQDFDMVDMINQDAITLQKKGYVDIEYDAEHANHMVRLILVLDHIQELYQEYYGKEEMSQEAIALEQLLCDYHEVLQTPWMQTFLKEEMEHLKAKGKLHVYVGKDILHIEQLFQVLAFIDKGGHSYVREMSIQLFQSSKYFEEELKPAFLSVVHKYEPHYLQAKQEEEDLIESELFLILGFRLYPEQFEWCGEVSLKLSDTRIIDTSLYPHGFVMLADQLALVEHIEVSSIHRMLLIENKTNYYRYLPQRKQGELVIFAGGHFSPMRKQCYQKLREHYSGCVQLWSDIDLGGFLMFARLQQEVFPNLTPYQMDVSTFQQYLAYGKQAEASYLKKIEKAKEKEILSQFIEVIDCILETGKTLEQEAIVLAKAQG